jgi:hypothetical protein
VTAVFEQALRTCSPSGRARQLAFGKQRERDPEREARTLSRITSLQCQTVSAGQRFDTAASIAGKVCGLSEAFEVG